MNIEPCKECGKVPYPRPTPYDKSIWEVGCETRFCQNRAIYFGKGRDGAIEKWNEVNG